MTDGVVVVDAGGQIIVSNPAAAAILGLPADQLQRRGFSEAVRDHRIQTLAAECAASGATQSGQVELRRPRKFLNVTATPLLDLPSREVLLIIHDYTGVQQAEASQREFVSNVSHELRNPLRPSRRWSKPCNPAGLTTKTFSATFWGALARMWTGCPHWLTTCWSFPAWKAAN